MYRERIYELTIKVMVSAGFDEADEDTERLLAMDPMEPEMRGILAEIAYDYIETRFRDCARASEWEAASEDFIEGVELIHEYLPVRAKEDMSVEERGEQDPSA